MTQEEKAKAYDEALEAARKELGVDRKEWEVVQRVLHNIFSELRESEDERIIGCIKKIVGAARHSQMDLIDDETADAILAYLEKQEQKPAECIEDSVKFEEGFKAGRESGLRDGQKYVLNNLDSYGLCKPAEWSDTKELVFKDICNHLEVEGYGGWVMLLNALRDGEFQPKPAWSEEDEDLINMLILHFNYLIDKGGDSVETYKSYREKLKSLRPQPREEIYQSAKHDLAIKFMNYIDENRPEGKMSLSNGECEDIDKAFKENDWAKIMRYVEKYRPSWKPSEEQLEALQRAIDACESEWAYQDDELRSLLKDLKKL